MSPQTSNYIKVKSVKKLKQENRKSLQEIYKAGSNDNDNQPGSCGMHSPVRNLTGVPMPGNYQSDISIGEGMVNEHGAISLPKPNSGSVEMPPEKPRPVLTSNELVYPYSYTQRFRPGYLLNESPADSVFGTSGMEAGANDEQPTAVTGPGNMYKELERTTGRDGNRIKRTRDRQRRYSRKR